MSEPKKQSEFDIFINNKIYPDSKSLINANFKPLSEIKNNCIVILDTNVLLLPYTIGKASLEEIIKIYLKLVHDNRLIIPGQVAREFVKNRPIKLCEIYKQLLDKKSKFENIQIGNYPLLEGLEEYKNIAEIEKLVNEKRKEYSKKIDSVLEKIKSWYWNDPVSTSYKDLFQESSIIDLEINENELKTELENRILHSIPPGYKDSSKEDKGIGDFLIWKTILNCGKNLNKDIIFVSGDVKPDWWHRSDNQGIYPRYELVDEFRRISDGKTIHIIEFSSFLKLFNASKEIIDEISNKEITNKDTSNKIDFASLFEVSNIPVIENYSSSFNLLPNKKYLSHELQRENRMKLMINVFKKRYIDLSSLSLSEIIGYGDNIVSVNIAEELGTLFPDVHENEILSAKILIEKESASWGKTIK